MFGVTDPMFRLNQKNCSLHAGHRKAVSYVKFMNGKQLVSCSVDNSLCLWDISSSSLVRTYGGHVNKKNFVGMSVNSNYIASGSEASQVRPMRSPCSNVCSWNTLIVQAIHFPEPIDSENISKLFIHSSCM